jgi:NAD+ kinase
MKVVVFGHEREKILEEVKNSCFEIVENNPDFVVSFGGDGTVMRSETEFPGIPKIILRNSKICKLCSSLSNTEVLKRVSENKFSIEKFWKLRLVAKGKEFNALNDVSVHNSDPRHAMRYRLLVNSIEVGDQIIGDGIVVATPFGSTGYYRSITDSFFELGIGLAFNNSTEQFDHMVLKEDSKIDLEVTRGPAQIYADNHKEVIELTDGDKVHIEKSEQFAQIVHVL